VEWVTGSGTIDRFRDRKSERRSLRQRRRSGKRSRSAVNGLRVSRSDADRFGPAVV